MIRRLVSGSILGLALLATPALAQDAAPLALQELREIKSSGRKSDASLQIRNIALKEAAISLGIREGLAFRTKEVNKRVEAVSANLDRIYDFRRIMLHAGGGTMLIPPVVTEAEEAWIVSPDGSNVGAAERVLKIQNRARLTSAPPSWRQYLIRGWAKPDLPPDILRPQTSDEREKWREWVDEGWGMGQLQAEDIFRSDLSRLERDFIGMTRYAVLVIEGIMEPPVVAQADRGVTGGGKSLKIGDRVIRITQPEKLKDGTADWKPAVRAGQ